MNLLLIITTASVVYGRTSNALDTQYSLLKPTSDTEQVSESSTMYRTSFNFTSGIPVEVDPSDTAELVGLNLTAPFIVTAVFKSYNGKQLCLFSITQDDRTVMSLCIQPAGLNISRITLHTELYSPDESISGLINENYKEKWFTIVVYVRDDKADIYVNCAKLPDTMILTKNKDVLLSKDMKLNLATSLNYNFKGLIEEISLYTNADEDTLRYECNKLDTTFNTEVKKDLAECCREMTSVKKDMLEQIENIKENFNEKNENMTMLMRNEIREDIDQLLSTNAYLLQELNILKEKIVELENQQKLSQNTEPTCRQKETSP